MWDKMLIKCEKWDLCYPKYGRKCNVLSQRDAKEEENDESETGNRATSRPLFFFFK